jgi:ferredoxin
MKKIIIYLLISVTLLSLIACKKPTEKEYNIDKSSCTGCGECIAVCPKDAIEYNLEGKAVIDQSKCVSCGECIAVCPEGAIY